MPTQYEVLQICNTSTQEEIRAAYKRRLLEVHPDKQALDGVSLATHAPVSVQDVQRAWDVLRHEDKRRQYDASLLADAQQRVTPWESVSLQDMQRTSLADGSTLFAYDCRCGEAYELTQAETACLQSSALLLHCIGCGNVLEINGLVRRQ
jgi:curved DNA-binding protein CbpA